MEWKNVNLQKIRSVTVLQVIKCFNLHKKGYGFFIIL